MRSRRRHQAGPRAGGRLLLTLGLLAAALLTLAGPGRADDEAQRRFDALLRRAALHLEEGQIAVADRLYAQAFHVARDELSDPDAQRTALTGRQQCAATRFDWPAQRDVAETFLALEQEEGAPYPLAEALVDLGYLEVQLGRTAVAVRHLEEALQLARAVDAPDLEADVLLRLAYAECDRQRLGVALRRAEAAEDILARCDACLRNWEVASALGQALYGVGAVAEALTWYREGRAAARDAPPEVRADFDQGIGLCLAARGETDAALAAFDRALATYRTLDLALLEAATWNHRAAVQRRLGALDRALADYETAGKRAPAGSGEHDAALEGVAAISLQLGRVAEARAAFEVVLARARASRDPRAEAHALAALGWLDLREGGLASAEDRAHGALDALGRVGAGLDPLAGPDVETRGTDALALARLVAVTLPDPAEGFRLLDRTRSSTLRGVFALRDVSTERGGPSSLLDDLQAAKERMRALDLRYRRVRASGRRAAAHAALVEARDARRVYVAALERFRRATTRDLAFAGYQPAGTDAARRALGPHDALVAYLFLEGRLHAFVLTRDEVRRVDLGPSAPVQEAATDMRRALTSEVATPHPARLRAQLLSPLGLPADTKRLFVCPDGPLAALPFLWLGGEMEVVFIPSVTTWTLLAEEADDHAGGRVLAIGDPRYEESVDGRWLRSFAGGRSLHALPAARGEIEAITGPGDVRLLGARATEAGLRRALAREEHWRAVHFACHGLTEPENPAWSSLALTAFGEDDGLLSVAEVLALSVPADLAVLSACETGLGREVEGEGLVSLSSAFLYAGAHRVIASLWKVDDEATRTLMESFYRHWRGTTGIPPMDAVSALEAAQLYVRSHRRWQHPQYWAAWMIWGLP